MVKKLLVVGSVIAAIFLAFLAINLIHFNFLTVKVVLYDALRDVLVAVVLVTAVILIGRMAKSISVIELGLAIAVGALGSAFYAIAVPTVIDRSLSVYLIEKLAQRGGGIREDAIPRVIRDEYMVEHHLADVRLTEQIDSGTVVIKDGCVLLTQRGADIVKWAMFFQSHALPKKRDIRGQISDDLTNPFRNSVESVDYRCK